MKRAAPRRDGASKSAAASLRIEYDNENYRPIACSALGLQTTATSVGETDPLEFAAHSNWRLQQHPMSSGKMHSHYGHVFPHFIWIYSGE
jgi:hypothetical protein